MQPVLLHHKKEIEQILRKDIPMHLLEIGDLDDFFFRYTSWLTFQEESLQKTVALLYSGMVPPTMIALCRDKDLLIDLLIGMKGMLPPSFYIHLTPDTVNYLSEYEIVKFYGRNHKMTLTKNQFIQIDPDIKQIRRLDLKDIRYLKELYEISYPGNWFDERMIRTGKYFGLFEKEELIGVAGIHVYSPDFQVAVLGNITVHPDFRRKYIARNLVSVLCSDLFETVEYIGLNVKKENFAAIKCYLNLGFEITGEFDEFYLKLKQW
jgi:ribosomal protein S18 acetylase RimI-like enzyme